MSRAVLHADVCVVGAGPAGAALAGRLAALGHSTVLVERHRLPRPHVGESLSPGVWPLLDQLGAREAVAAAGFVEAREAVVRWGGSERHTSEPGAEPALTVDRGEFDRLLAAGAEAAGAVLREASVARAPVRSGDRWEVPLDGDGPHVVRARFLADASGRRRLLGGRRRATAARTIALCGVWRGVPERDGALTRVEALADGWAWGAHLPDGGFRAMVFVDPEQLRNERRPDAVLARVLARSALFADVLGARLAGRVAACDATCFADDTPVDTAHVKVGEAAFAIDPLSSSGVQTAIQTALAAAASVHSLLGGGGDPDAALDYYAEAVGHAVRRHGAIAAELYGEAGAHAGRQFWRARAATAERTPAPRPSPPLGALLAQRVRLSSDAALVHAPCIVGDRVERRRALTHPALSRPVAFLGGEELAPLVDGLLGPQRLGEVVAGDWARRVSAERALEIAAWLSRRGLLEPA
jgi:flavin-dependent dehydrogenase